MALSLVILSSLVHEFRCQIIGIELQTSSMPMDGDAWATYYQSTHNTIWLLSPRKWSQAVLDLVSFPYVISYDIGNDLFETQPNITNTTPSFHGWAPRYFVTIEDDIYLNGDTGAIAVYNVHSDTTTTLHTIPWRQSCLATDGRFIFFLGGEVLDNIHGDKRTKMYDTNTDTWYSGNEQLYSIRTFPCEVINGAVYTFGGSVAQPTKYISKLNVGTGSDVIANYQNNNWEAAGKLLIGRYKHNTARCDSLDGNLVFVIGGMTLDNERILDIAIYDTHTETTQFAPFTLNEGRRNPAVMCIDSHIYIFGGINPGQTSTRYSWEKSILAPSVAPTMPPTLKTNELTKQPSVAPTISPTLKTDKPTKQPSVSPTILPTSMTDEPTEMPSFSPTLPPSKHRSTPTMIAVVVPPSRSSSSSTQSTVVQSYSLTVFEETEDGNNASGKESHVDAGIVVLVMIIVLSSIAIVFCLFRLSKMRKQAVQNMNRMTEKQNSTKNAAAVNAVGTTENENPNTDDVMNIVDAGEEGDLANNDDDDELMEAVNQTIGGMQCETNDDDVIMEGVHITAGQKEEDTHDLIHDDEFVIDAEDQMTPKGTTAS